MASPILVLSTRSDLVSLAERCAAAVGVRVEVLDRVDAARPRWRAAAAVVVGDDLVLDLVDLAPAHRSHVLVVADEPQDHWRDAVSLGAVALVAPADESAILAALAAAVDGQDEACVVAVVGACGGVGASTFAAGIAVQAPRRGVTSLALDADPLGGGLDLVLGAEHAPGLRWHEVDPGSEHLAAEAFTESLPTALGAAVLSFGRGTPAGPVPASAVLRAAQRGVDLVVADVPRHGVVHGDPLTLAVLDAATSVVVLVPENVRGLAAATVLVEQLSVPVLAVAAAASQGVDRRELERVLGVPVIARLGASRALERSVDAGRGPRRSRSLVRAADLVLDAVGLGA